MEQYVEHLFVTRRLTIPHVPSSVLSNHKTKAMATTGKQTHQLIPSVLVSPLLLFTGLYLHSLHYLYLHVILYFSNQAKYKGCYPPSASLRFGSTLRFDKHKIVFRCTLGIAVGYQMCKRWILAHMLTYRERERERELRRSYIGFCRARGRDSTDIRINFSCTLYVYISTSNSSLKKYIFILIIFYVTLCVVFTFFPIPGTVNSRARLIQTIRSTRNCIVVDNGITQQWMTALSAYGERGKRGGGVDIGRSEFGPTRSH